MIREQIDDVNDKSDVVNGDNVRPGVGRNVIMSEGTDMMTVVRDADGAVEGAVE